MNKDLIAGNWKQVKGAVKVKWGKLTDNDLKVIDGRSEQLVGRLQERYGLAKDAARTKFAAWHKAHEKKVNAAKLKP